MIGLVHDATDAFRGHWPECGVKGLAEDLAVRYLRRHGCVVLDRNYRSPGCAGEIDLVACQGATLVFVEVRKRTTHEYGAPGCSGDSLTRNVSENAARDYVYRNGVEWLHRRFDVVSVVLSNPVRVAWTRDVFREDTGELGQPAGSGGTRTGQIRPTPQSRSSL